MRETTIRRLLVIVLCASGVVALWIVADRSVSTPDAVSSARPEVNGPSGSRAASPIVSTRSTAASPDHNPGHPSADGPATEPIGRPTTASGSHSQRHHQPSPGDSKPPAVRGLHVVDNNHDSITIRWRPIPHNALDTAAIAYYQATLNGIPAGETAGLQLTINWFNDDMTSHFIRVRAVDVDGNRGLRGSPLVVTRPDRPSPTPPSSPTPTRTPSPTPTPSPSPTPSPAPPSASPTPSSPDSSPPGFVPPQPAPQPSPTGATGPH